MSEHNECIQVTWPDGSASTLPNLWLRDNCQCDECRAVQTSEKRFILTSVPENLAPERFQVDDDNLHLHWPDGHRSTYVGSFVRALTTPAQPAWRPWGSEFEPQRATLGAFLDDDATASRLISQFIDDGAIVLTDASSVPGTLEILTARLGPIREVLFDRIHNVRVDPKGYNVAHTAMALPPHNDFASYAWPPSVQALHMLVNDTPGGETIVVDGWRVLEELRRDQPEHFAALCSMAVPFREFDDNNETRTVAPIINLHADGRIERFRFSNQLMQPMDPTQPGVASFYRAYHALARRLTEPAAKATFRLESGHILLVAAHRVLHAREAFEPIAERHLQDAYFEFDNVCNSLVVLERRMAVHHG